MTDERSLERAARLFIEVGPVTAPQYAVDEALRLIEHIPQERDQFPWRFPNMTLSTRVAALLAVGAIIAAGAVAIGVGGRGSAQPVTSSPTPSAASVVPSIAAPIRPSAPLDRATAVIVVNSFLDHLNAGRVDEAADLVWIGAMVNGTLVTGPDDARDALATACGFVEGPLLNGGGNTLSWEGWLKDRPGYACPRDGQGVRSRIVVENGLVVEYTPAAMTGQSP